MSLAVLINSAIDDMETHSTAYAEVAADATITALGELPLRVEVFEKAQNMVMGDLSIAEVHAVLDALIEVLKGE